MEFENKIISREIQENLYSTGKTLATAESCTGGRIAESIIAVPGASEYFKGGIICYTNEVKERLLHVDPQLIEEKTAVCEEVAISMVKGATEALNTDYAVAATGVAGPGGGTKDIPVGTIWLACGSKDKVVTLKIEEDNGRDKNLAIATFRAMQLLKEFLDENNPKGEEKDEDRISPIGQI
jgi:nicotinamide-nucleotide amidase